MTVSLTLLITAGALVAGGVFLITERTLTRIVIGLALLGNGINLFILSQGGASYAAPIVEDLAQKISDPLPQALILTAIVLTLATTAFGLALAYRSWKLQGHDEVVDDVEDRRLADKANTTAWAGRLDLEIDLDSHPTRLLGKGAKSASEEKNKKSGGDPKGGKR